MTPEELIERYRRAWETANADEVVDLFTPKASYPVQRPTGPASFASRTAAATPSASTGGAAPVPQREVAVQTGRPVVSDDRVAMEWWATMINPDKGEITLPGCLLLRFAADGRCRDLWEYWQGRQDRHGPPMAGCVVRAVAGA